MFCPDITEILTYNHTGIIIGLIFYGKENLTKDCHSCYRYGTDGKQVPSDCDINEEEAIWLPGPKEDGVWPGLWGV